MNHMILANGQYAIGKFIPEGSTIVPARPSEAHSWDGTNWVFDGYTTEVAMNRLRLERNQLLASADWRMTTDYPYDDQAEWASYRTQLRDLPATAEPTLSESGELIVDWPTAPDQK